MPSRTLIIIEVSSKVPFWYPHDSRSVLEVSYLYPYDRRNWLEVPFGILIIVEVG